MNPFDARTLHRSPADLDRRDSEWNRAVANSVQADPFCCRTEWQLSFHETHYPHRPLHLLQSGNSHLALAEQGEPGSGVRLEPLECHWVFGCPLLGPRAVEMLAELVDAFDAQRGLVPEILIGGLLPGGERKQELLRRFGSRYEFYRAESRVERCASLAGGLDGYLSRRSPKHRRNLRQAARRAAARGVEFERLAPQDRAEADAAYARMVAVELASWKGIGACGMAEPPSRAFYECLLRRMAQAGIARVVFARCGERDIGFVFGGLADAIYRGQQFSYAEDWSGASIGNLLQYEQLAWLCEERAVRYDMGPLMEYKLHWTELEVRSEPLLLLP